MNDTITHTSTQVPASTNFQHIHLKDEQNIKVGSFYYYSNVNNCKLITIDMLGNVIRSNRNALAGFKAFMDRSSYVMFNCNLLNLNEVQELQKLFKTAYIQKVPLGYGAGFQYHCGFFTPQGANSTYARRFDNQAKEVGTIVSVIERPIVNRNLLLKLTPEQLVKYQGYKYPGNAAKYLNSILK